MAGARPTTQSIRLRGPSQLSAAQESGSSAEFNTSKSKDTRPTALLHDTVRRHQRPPWAPGYSAALRILLLVRVSSAMYSAIGDCDETFNYWEPLHLLSHPPSSQSAGVQAPFQTWEYSPEYAIRSWAYLMQYLPIAGWLPNLMSMEKRQAFFAVRILLAFTSSAIEARFYRTVVECVHHRVGRYLLVMLVASAGMWEASTALLPSTFAMYTTTLALSYGFHPTSLPASQAGNIPTAAGARSPTNRTLATTGIFALGAILGWPFALVLGLPYVFEELFIQSGDRVAPKLITQWFRARISRWISAVFTASLIAVPVFIIDTLAYGRTVLVPLNIVRYNVLSARRGAGPGLYGTAPTSYYLQNLALNFNILLPLALLSAPALALTLLIDRARLGLPVSKKAATSKAQAESKDAPMGEGSSPPTLLMLRLAPFYAWLALLNAQAHKEERFMFPTYPLLAFNAAVTLYLARGWVEVAYVRWTKSPYKASRTWLFSTLTFGALLVSSLISVSRVLAQSSYYHAPFHVLFNLESSELPLAVSALFPDTIPPAVQVRLAAGLPPTPTPQERARGSYDRALEDALRVSLAPLRNLDSPLTLCYGKEWHRFPSSYLVPDGVRVEFIKSEFEGILPKHFVDPSADKVAQASPDAVASALDKLLGWAWPWKQSTWALQQGFNDMNREETDRYVDLATCDYLVDLDHPHRFASATPPQHEPRYAIDSASWDRIFCAPFLDAEYSRAGPNASFVTRLRATLARALWLPGQAWQETNRFGDYCLLRSRNENSRVKNLPERAEAAAKRPL